MWEEFYLWQIPTSWCVEKCGISSNLRGREINDKRIGVLLQELEIVNYELNPCDLYPAHGDAHPKNIISSSKGWLMQILRMNNGITSMILYNILKKNYNMWLPH